MFSFVIVIALSLCINVCGFNHAISLRTVANHTVQLKFSKKYLLMPIKHRVILEIVPSDPVINATDVYFLYFSGQSVFYEPPKQLIYPLDNFTIPPFNTSDVSLSIVSRKAGHLTIGLNTSSDEIRGLVNFLWTYTGLHVLVLFRTIWSVSFCTEPTLETMVTLHICVFYCDRINESYILITIVNSEPLRTFSDIIGWAYFVAWSVSFYPQVILNIQRQSVIGLHFDYLALNFIGYLTYSLFTVGLLWIPRIQKEYRDIHPRGVIPVEINDAVFALHGFLLTVIIISQCFCFKRGDQRVSRVCLLILGACSLGIVIVISLGSTHVITWLNAFYFFSYVKLGVTIIKYIPQAWFNYRRKSTVGFSIINILLDFAGGMLSIMQMFIVAYNSDDWTSLFGNPTKFGLGLFTILFDVLFIIQHFCLYRQLPGYERIIPAPLQ